MSGVIIASGSGKGRKLQLKNEELISNIISARKIVNWYNDGA